MERLAEVGQAHEHLAYASNLIISGAHLSTGGRGYGFRSDSRDTHIGTKTGRLEMGVVPRGEDTDTTAIINQRCGVF